MTEGGLRKEATRSCLFFWKPWSLLRQTAFPTFPAALLCDFERGSLVTDSSPSPVRRRAALASASSQLWEDPTELSGGSRQRPQPCWNRHAVFELSRNRNQITIVLCCCKLKERGFHTGSVTMRQASHRIADPGDNKCKFLGCCLLLLWDFLSA